MKNESDKKNSNYARKKKWLKSNNVDFGFQVPEPKPWKKTKKSDK